MIAMAALTAAVWLHLRAADVGAVRRATGDFPALNREIP
jgi:hypothetical protein